MSIKIQTSRFNNVLLTALVLALPGMGQANQTYTAANSGGNIIVVQSARVGSSVSLGGSVVPYREVTLSAQIPGRIEYLAGEEGDRFEENALLAKINDDALRAKRGAAEAELQNAYAQMRNADIQYNRELWAPNSVNKAPGGMGLPSLFDQFITKPMANMAGQNKPYLERHADLVSQGTQVDAARTAILRAQSAIQGLDVQLRDTRSLAPFEGVIARKMVEVGDSVQPGQPIYKYADLQYLQIEIDVPARLMPGLRKGMIVPAKLDVGDRQVQVRIAQIFPIADSRRHTVTVKFDLPTGAPAAPGMYANVMIPDANAPARDTMVIPNTAVIWRGSLPAVEVLNEQNQPELRLVRVGEQLDRDHITILSGLESGERVVDRPAQGTSSNYTNPTWSSPSKAAQPAPLPYSAPQSTLPPYSNNTQSSQPAPLYGQPSYGQQQTPAASIYDPNGSYNSSQQYYIPR